MTKIELRIAIERALRSAQISGIKFMNDGDVSKAEDVIRAQSNALIAFILENEPVHESQVL